MKKRVLVCVLLFMLVMSGCSFRVGNVQNGLKGMDYEEIFPENRPDSNVHKTSYKIYDYELGEYGQMQIAVDTSKGHQFEVVEGTSNFKITDEDGTTVLNGGFMTLEQYKAMTAELDEVRQYNNRDFLVMEAGTDLYDAFSYVADCGVECGMVLETKEEENLKLVAFGGTPLEGSSSDVMYYKGEQ